MSLVRRMAGACRLVPSLVLLASRLLAQQESVSAVTFEMRGCDELGEGEVRRIVALEIAPGLRLSDGEDVSRLRATVRCEESRAHVEVAQGAELPLELELDFDRVPSASRARLLALAIAELLATREIEHSGMPLDPEPDVASHADPARSLSEPTSSSRTFGWAVAPGATWLPAPRVALVGGNLGVWARSGPVVLLGDFEVRAGRKQIQESEINVTAYSFLFGFSPSPSTRMVDFHWGPGARFGWGQLSANSTRNGVEGRHVAGVWWGPAFTASLKWRFTSWVVLHGGAEVGHVMRPVRGMDEEGRRLIALDGPWAAASIGLGGAH
jgi:hypothetical protein